MSNLVKLAATAAAMSLLAACSGGSSVLTPVSKTPVVNGTQYTQIERLSRPAIKEVFEPFQDHQKSNAVEPYKDATISADIVATEDALRPPNTSLGSDYGAFLNKVLYPDEYTVNLNGTAPTSANNDPEFFLSNEVDGASYFGGRAPNDDVIDLELPVLFGGTLAALKLQPEDNEENNCLSAQNIAAEDPSKKTTSTFPYLPVAH